MSTKNKSKKTNNKTKNIPLLGDNKKQKQWALIGLAISCIMAVIIFCFIIPSLNTPETPDDEIKQTVDQDLSLNILGSSLIEANKCYNVWFDIKTIVEDGEITFDVHDGMIMKYDNSSEETSPVTSAITFEDTQKYSFIWVFDQPENATILTDVVVTVENKTLKKSAGCYLFCDGAQMGYLNEQQYTVLRQAEDTKNND